MSETTETTVSVIIPVESLTALTEADIKRLLEKTEKGTEYILTIREETEDTGRLTAGKDNVRIYVSANPADRLQAVRQARGTYLMFADPACVYNSKLFEKTAAFAGEHQSDIAAFDYSLEENGVRTGISSVRKGCIRGNQTDFSYRDCRDDILDVLNPGLFNKLYRTDFIKDCFERYEGLAVQPDIAVNAVTSFEAGRISWMSERLAAVSSEDAYYPDCSLAELTEMLTRTEKYISESEHAGESGQALTVFSLHRYTDYLETATDSLKHVCTEADYDALYQEFCRARYDVVTADLLHDDITYLEFCAVRKHPYQEMKELLSKELIISGTSYPARIQYVSKMAETLFAQNRKADRIILWLAEEQFPGKEADLPRSLLDCREKGLEICWCSDLKSHKKYFRTMQEYPEAVIITVDDDIYYPADMTERLYLGYLNFPDAVSAGRVNLASFDENGEILPYSSWITECSSCRFKPSMQLTATGCAGILYPPHILDTSIFDEEGIRKTCLTADDLWLKAIECISHVPVVLMYPLRFLSYIDNSQDTALWKQNVNAEGNDVQLKNIESYFADEFGSHWLQNSMLDETYGFTVRTVEDFCRFYIEERAEIRSERNDVNNRLNRSEQQRRALNDKLQQTYKEKSELNTKLQQTYKEKSELNTKLQQTYKEKSERGEKIKELEKELDEAKHGKLLGRIFRS